MCGRKHGQFFKVKCIVVRRFRASAKRSSQPGTCSRRQKGCRTYGWTLFQNVSDPCDFYDGHQVTNTIRQSLWNRQRHNLGTWYGSTLDVGSEVGSAIHWVYKSARYVNCGWDFTVDIKKLGWAPNALNTPQKNRSCTQYPGS